MVTEQRSKPSNLQAGEGWEDMPSPAREHANCFQEYHSHEHIEEIHL